MYVRLHLAVLIILCILMVAAGVWAGHMKWDMIEKDGKKIKSYWHKKDAEKDADKDAAKAPMVPDAAVKSKFDGPAAGMERVYYSEMEAPFRL